MPVQVVMPQLGESIVEGTVAKWLVKEGDPVEKDQPLLEVSTDKVDTELPSPAAGVVGKILVAEGETVDVNTLLTTIEEAGKADRPAPPAPAPAAAPPEKAAPAPPADAGEEEAAQRTEKEAEATPPAPPRPARGEEPRPRISPLVRRMAEEHAIDLSKIQGSGIDGRVTKNDVLAYLGKEEPGKPATGDAPGAKTKAAPRPAPAAGKAAAPAGPLPGGLEDYVLVPRPAMPSYKVQPGDEVVPFTRIRKLTADHMVYSNVISPRVTTVAEVNMARVAKIREAHKAALKKEGVSFTYLPFVIAALVRAIRDYPGVNASVEGDQLIIKKAVHVGVAVDTDRGLLVPAVRDANEKSLLGIARAVQDLGDRARKKKLLPDDITSGTIAVSNPGAKGNLFGTPVINQPHVVIVRMGEVVKRPVVVTVDGEDLIAIRPMMYLALTYDHRVVDGLMGNSCLHRIKEILEEGDFDL